MSGEDFSPAEIAGRLHLAQQSYAAWSTEDLWSELGLVIDEAWEGRSAEQGPEPEAWAKREAIGLALIARGFRSYELVEPVMPDRFREPS